MSTNSKSYENAIKEKQKRKESQSYADAKKEQQDVLDQYDLMVQKRIENQRNAMLKGDMTAQLVDRGFMNQQTMLMNNMGMMNMGQMGMPNMTQMNRRTGLANMGSRPQIYNTLVSEDIFIASLNAIDNLLSGSTTQNTLTDLNKYIETLKSNIDDAIYNNQRRIPELKSTLQQFSELIKDKPIPESLEKFLKNAQDNLNNAKYIKSMTEIKNDEEREYRENIKTVAQSVRGTVPNGQQPPPMPVPEAPQPSEISVDSNFTKRINKLQISNESKRNFIKLFEEMFDNSIEPNNINLPEPPKAGFIEFFKAYVDLAKLISDSHLDSTRQLTLINAMKTKCEEIYAKPKLKKATENEIKAYTNTINAFESLLRNMSGYQNNDTQSFDAGDESEASFASIFSQGMSQQYPQPKTSEQRTAMQSTAALAGTMIKGATNVSQMMVSAARASARLMQRMDEALSGENYVPIYINIQKMKNDINRKATITNFLKNNNIFTNNQDAVDLVLNIVDQPEYIHDINDDLNEFDVKVVDTNENIPNNISLTNVSMKEEDNDIYLYLHPDFKLRRQRDFVNFFEDNNKIIFNDKVQNKTAINEIYNQLKKYKNAKTNKQKNNILQTIENNYGVIIKFDDLVVNTHEFRGSAVWNVFAIALNVASALFSFNGNNADNVGQAIGRAVPFIQRRTNGYDFLISFITNILPSFERGFTTEGQHRLELQQMFNTDARQHMYFEGQDSSTISSDNLIIICGTVGFLIMGTLYMQMRTQNNQIHRLLEMHRQSFEARENVPAILPASVNETNNNNNERLAILPRRRRGNHDDVDNGIIIMPEAPGKAPVKRPARAPSRAPAKAPAKTPGKRTTSAKPVKRARGIGGNFINDFASNFVDIQYMRNAKKALETYGDWVVVDSFVGRSFIQGNFLNKVFRFVNYDDLYHIKLVVILENEDGEQIDLQIEKRPQVSISPYVEAPNEEQMDTDLSGITLFDLVEETRKAMGDKNFFTYSAFEKNCQDLVLSILETHGSVDDELQEFILQEFDLTQIDKRLIKTAKTITDLSRIYHAVFTGGKYK